MTKFDLSEASQVHERTFGRIPKSPPRNLIAVPHGIRPPFLPPKRRLRSADQERAIVRQIATCLDLPAQEITGVVEWVSPDLRAAVAHQTTIFVNEVCVIAIEKAAEKVKPGDLQRL